MQTEFTVRGYHTDTYQHVNHARFLEFLEEGRWQAIEKYIGLDYFSNNSLSTFVININISYKHQVRVNDRIVVTTSLVKIDKVKAIIKQQILNKTTEKLCVDADVTVVIINAQEKPMRLEGTLRQTLSLLPLFKG